MAATKEDLHNDALYQIWEFTGAFDSVIATNGPDSDIELWTKARKCAIEIGKSTFVDKEVGFNEDNSFYPSEKFRRFCSEAEFDKEHDSCWVMTFKAVLFTMVYPLGIFIEDVAEEEEEEMENSEHKIMYESLKFPKYDILGLTKKGKIFRKMIIVLDKWNKICNEQNPYLKYNQEDEKYLEEDSSVEENVVRRGRPKMNQEETKGSFEISNKTEHINAQLQLFYQALKEKGFVDKDTDQQVFINMFAGKAPAEKIKWTGLIYELHYLFKKLFHLKLIKQHPTSVRKWEAVCSCFQLLKRNGKVGNKRKEYNYELNDITTTQINHGGKMPESHEELDNIIALLNPKLDILRALDSLNGARNEIKDEFDDLQVYDKRE